MAYAVPQLTDYGMSLLIRAIGGEKITFTRMAIGNGDVPVGTDPASLNNLVNEQLSFGIVSIETEETGYVRIIGRFDSTEIVNDFRWKELGVFCKGEDNVEKLYAYCNDGNNAGMLKANASDVTAEQSVGLIVEVGTASSVTAIIAPSVLYVQQSDFDAHLVASNPHGITKQTVSLENVPNVTTNDQTPTYTTPSSASNLVSGEKLSIAFGKLARAVMNMISHISDHSNPHGNTPASIGAASVEHTHSAADITSGIFSPTRGGTGVSSYSALVAKLYGEGIPNVVCGSYTGTGNYGSTHPNTLTFSKAPKFILIMPESNTLGGTYGGFLAISGVESLRAGGLNDDVANDSSQIYLTWGTLSVSWYGTAAKYQQNANGTRYIYMAVL